MVPAALEQVCYKMAVDAHGLWPNGWRQRTKPAMRLKYSIDFQPAGVGGFKVFPAMLATAPRCWYGNFKLAVRENVILLGDY